MDSGDTFTRRGQRYRFVGWTPHLTRYGRWITLAVLKSICPECGRSFQCKATATAIRSGMLIRRCWRHYAPGVPVRRKRPCRDVFRTAEEACSPRRHQASPSLPLAVKKPSQQPPRPASTEEVELQAIIETYRFALNMMDD
jgi:hypothetical protein